MSASERLRELVNSFYDAEFPSTPGEEAPTPLVRALPEIVAVVEAAEASGDYIIGSKFSMEQPFVSERIRDIRAALAALEEKLKP